MTLLTRLRAKLFGERRVNCKDCVHFCQGYQKFSSAPFGYWTRCYAVPLINGEAQLCQGANQAGNCRAFGEK